MEIVANSIVVSAWSSKAYEVRSRRYIYAIKCKINSKRYIGETCYPRLRFMGHIYKLRGGKHHNKALQADFDKYGEENFEIKILDITEAYEPTACRLEQEWIKKTNAFNPSNGYNDDKKSKVARGDDPCPWLSGRGKRKNKEVTTWKTKQKSHYA